MARFIRCIAFLLVVALSCGCSGKKKPVVYQIGIDRSWYPLEISGQEKNLLAFSVELLVEVAKEENLQLSVQNMNWDNILWGLREHKYNGMLSSMRPYTFYLKDYSFSSPYLMTGPVLVVPKDSKIKGIKQLKGQEVGVVRGSSAALILQKVPGIILKGYGTIAQTLDGLSKMEINAAAIEVLIAQNYVRDIYSDSFKIASAPLSDEGIRLITLHGDAPELVKRFDHGLKRMKKTGAYDKLLEKWGLSPDGKPIAHLDQHAETFLSQYIF